MKPAPGVDWLEDYSCPLWYYTGHSNYLSTMRHTVFEYFHNTFKYFCQRIILISAW